MGLNNSKETENKDSKINIKLLLIIVLIVIPLIIVTLLYNINSNFNKKTKSLLVKIPGPVGQYFKGTPTESERQERIEYLSEHFLTIDSEVAADKIYIIKKDDEKLYIEIIKGMNKLSPEKTEEVVLKVRSIEMRKDLLASVYDEATEQERNNFLSEVSRIQGQDLIITINEIERKFSSREFQEILSEVSNEKLGEILYYTDSDIRNYILESFDTKKQMDVELEISKVADGKNNLYDLAKYYETKPVEEVIDILGNDTNHDIDKLATIYRNMSVVKTAEILAEVDDDDFIENLFNAILKEDSLMGTDTHLTNDISRAMEFFNEYKERIGKLVKVYGEMNPSNVAEIAERMMENDNTVTIFNFDIEETYKLSDKVIIIDILSDLKRDQLSQVLDTMKPDKASKLTELLAKPKEKIYNYDEGGENIEDVD